LKHGKLYGFGAVFLIVLTLAGLYIYDPAIFSNSQQNTTLSISQINVDPQGSPVGNEWKGSFWNLLVYVNANDDIAGVILPKGQTGSITYQGAVEALKTGAKVEIKIDPQQPYLIRDLQEKYAMPAPGAVGVATSTTQLDLRYYGWGEATWRIYTPFTVSIYKDGVLVGQTTLNDQGQSSVQSVSTSEGAVRIENLGLLGGSYTSPNTPSQICILKGYPNVYDLTQVNSIISGTYGNYWFGTRREGNNVAVNPTMVYPGLLIGNVYPPSTIGGWKSLNSGGSDVGGKVDPVKPVISSGEKSSLPSDKQKYSSLTEYIAGSGIADLANSLFQSRAAGFSGALWQKVSLVTDTNGQTALKLDIPWSAFGTPLVNIRVPTELADTFVEQPIVTSTQVSAVWQTSGTAYGDISGSLRIACTVTNTGTVTGSTMLSVSSGNSKLSLTPLTQTVNNLQPNVPQTVYFDATNLGVENEISNIPVTIIAKDTYTGSETGRCTLYGTLLSTLTPGTTTLSINVYEKGTTTPAPNLQLSVQYGTQTLTPVTDANGGTGGLTLTTPQGGAFVGSVLITSMETSTYKAGTMTYQINQAGAYIATYEVERKDTQYIDWVLIAIIVIIVVVFVAIIGGGVYALRKNKHGGKHR